MENSTEQLVGKVVFAAPALGSDFFVIVGETPHTVLLKPIQAIRTEANPMILGQRGMEVPVPFDETYLKYDNPKCLVRAKKHEPDYPGDHLWFSCGRQAFFLWNGKPRQFDSMG